MRPHWLPTETRTPASAKVEPDLGLHRFLGHGPTIASVNPASGAINAEIATSSPEQIAGAVAAARKAVSGEWSQLRPHQRSRILMRVAEAIADDADRLARLQTLENGKTLAESRSQARAAADTFRYFASICETSEGELNPPRGAYVALTTYEPAGVVAAITPWNSPLSMTSQKIAPALAAGNAVVVKPSEVTTLTILALAETCLKAGLPEGVLSVVAGARDVGAILVEDPGVNLVSFTGGTEGGRAIAQQAARRLVPTILELGGKSPNLVFADADLEAAAAGVAYGIFHSTGQSCVAGSRVFIERTVYRRFLNRLAEIAASLRVGMPDDPGTKLGPCASFAQRDRIAEYVRLGLGEGAALICGGGQPSDPALAKGAFYLPTILADLDNRARVAQEEIFGPVLVAIPFDTESDLVDAANDSPFGLACGIWTSDYRRAWAIARQMQAGTVWINTYKDLSVANPFGGFKESGLGREKGPAGFRAYQLAKSIYLGLQTSPNAWAQS